MEIPVRERLISGFDFHPPAIKSAHDWLHRRVKLFAENLSPTGIVIKVNSAAGALGYEIANTLHQYKLKVMMDLKHYDISRTLETYGVYLAEVQPEIVTVSLNSSVKGISALKRMLPHTEVIGITVPTDMEEEEAVELYGCPLKHAVLKLARRALRAGIDGIVCSPHELPFLKENLDGFDRLKIITAAVRPKWSKMSREHQNSSRVGTPEDAIHGGAHRIVVVSPIMQSENIIEAITLTIKEIEDALKSK